MTDIASLGFDIDTQPLARANTELMTLVRNATQAERAVDGLSKTLTGFGARSASNINAASTAFRAVGGAASSAASTVNTANSSMANSATAAATAQGNAAAAAQRAATAQSAAAAATNAAAAANNRLAANTNAVGAAHRASAGHVNNYNSSVTNTTKSVGGLVSGMATLVTYLLGSAVVKAIDNYTNLTNAMKLAGVTGGDLVTVQDRLFQAANTNGVPVEALTTLYRRGSIAAKELGKSQNELLKVVDVVAASLRLQGTSVEAARGALLQLGQSFGTGVVHAEEYNSLLENAFPLLQAAAAGMKGMDGSVSKLTNAVKAGKVSSKDFFDAIMKGGDDIIRQSQSMQLTVGGAWQVVVNGFTAFVGKVAEATGVTRTLTTLMGALGQSLTDLSKDNEFLHTAATLFYEISNAIKPAWEGITLLGKALKENFGDVLMAAIQGSIGMLRLMGDVATGVARVLDAAFGTIRDMAKTKAMDSATDAINAQKKFIEQREEQIKSLDRKIDSQGRRVPVGQDKLNPASGLLMEHLATRAATIEALKKDYETLNALEEKYNGIVNPPLPKGSRQMNYGAGVSNLDDKGSAVEIVKKNKGAEDSYRRLIQSAENYISIEAKKTDALSMSIEEGKVFVHEQELINKALMAGIKPGEEMQATFRGLAQRMAEADNAYATAKFIKDAKKDADAFVAAQEVEQNALTMSYEKAFAYRKEQELLVKAKADGIKITPEVTNNIREIATATAHAAAETKNYSEMLGIAKDLGKSAIEGILQALVRGQSVWDAFANAATRALDRIISKIADVAIDSMFDMFSSGSGSSSKSSSGSSGGLGFLKNLFNSGNSSGSGGFFSNIGNSLSDMWGQTSNFFGFGGDSMANAGQAGSAFFGPAAPSTGIFGSGISGLSALGAGAGALSGVMQLINGGGSTKSMIGGIGSMVGAAVSLIPGIGQIAGPIISILSNVLPSLIGESEKRTYSSTNASLHYGPGGYQTGGSAMGNADVRQSQGVLAQAGAGMQGIYDLLGGVKDASKVWGMGLSSWTASGNNWSYTSNATHLLDPNGNRSSWRMNEDGMVSTASARATINSILGGAVGEISDAMTTALTTIGQSASTTLENVGQAVVFVRDIYDQLGKPVLTTKAALTELDNQFKSVSATATSLGLSLDPVNAALEKARTDVAKSFLHDVNMYFDPLTTSMQDFALASAQAKAELQYLIDQGLASTADMQRLDNYNLEQEMKLKEKIYGVTLANIQDVLTRLRTGDLSGATNTTQYNAAYEAFNKTMADALSGDTGASARALDEAVSLAKLGQARYGSTERYQQLKAEIEAATQRLESMVGSSTSPSSGTTGTPVNSEYVQTLLAQNAQLQAAVMSQTTQINNLLTQLAKLSDLMQRVATNA